MQFVEMRSEGKMGKKGREKIRGLRLGTREDCCFWWLDTTCCLGYCLFARGCPWTREKRVQHFVVCGFLPVTVKSSELVTEI